MDANVLLRVDDWLRDASINYLKIACTAKAIYTFTDK